MKRYFYVFVSVWLVMTSTGPTSKNHLLVEQILTDASFALPPPVPLKHNPANLCGRPRRSAECSAMKCCNCLRGWNFCVCFNHRCGKPWRRAMAQTWKLCVLVSVTSTPNTSLPTATRIILINVCLFNFRFSILHTRVCLCVCNNPQPYISIPLSPAPSLLLSPPLFILDRWRKNLQWNENKGSFALIIFGVEGNLFSFY